MMYDYTKKTLMKYRPRLNCIDAVDCCLNRLFADNCKLITDNVVDGLTYEEVIGALLLARDLACGKNTDV